MNVPEASVLHVRASVEPLSYESVQLPLLHVRLILDDLRIVRDLADIDETKVLVDLTVIKGCKCNYCCIAHDTVRAYGHGVHINNVGCHAVVLVLICYLLESLKICKTAGLNVLLVDKYERERYKSVSCASFDDPVF